MRTTPSRWSRWGVAVAILSLLSAVPIAEARAGDEASRPDGKPAQPGKKKPGKKQGKGKNKKPKGPKLKGPFEKDEYPIQEQYRPLVLPNGMGEVTIAPAYRRVNVPVVGGEDFVTTTVDFDYGLGDLVELGVGSGLQFAPDVDWSNEIHAHVHWLAYDGRSFDLAPGVLVPFTFVEGAPLVVSLDALGRYLFADQFFLTFGRRVFDIGVNPDFTLTMNANAGFGVQVSKPAVLWLDTNLLSVPLAPDPTVTGPWDRIAIALGGQYTPARTFDLGLVLSYANVWEVEEESDLGVQLYGRVRF